MVEPEPSTNAPTTTKAARKRRQSPNGFVRAEDGAARLFGTDVRLRNLMALAKYGPLYLADLGRIANAGKVTVEGRDNAPFGRASLVRVWETSGLRAAALDPTFPPYAELGALLKKLEATYPLTYTPRRASPKVPSLTSVWNGDYHCLFGSEVPTSILMTIGVLGWTFESLCVATAIGYDRVVVKKALKRLEDEGILSSSRSHRPGFNVRVIGISETFPARDELHDLLNTCVRIWPEYTAGVRTGMELMRSRTAEHLRRRGLVVRDPWGAEKPALDSASLSMARRKAKLTAEYRTLAKTVGHSPIASELHQNENALYNRIMRCWPTFEAFCIDNRVVPDYRNSRRSQKLKAAIEADPKAVQRHKTPTLGKVDYEVRRECILRYRQHVARNGREISSRELMAQDSGLYMRIRKRFGTFEDFRKVAGLQPKKLPTTVTANPILRQRCIKEYFAATEQYRRDLNAADLQRENPALYHRIKIQWGSFSEFCVDLRIVPPRHARHWTADKSIQRERCIQEYRNLMQQLQRVPTSGELLQYGNGLYKRIRKLWGNIACFCVEIGVPPPRRFKAIKVALSTIPDIQSTSAVIDRS